MILCSKRRKIEFHNMRHYVNDIMKTLVFPSIDWEGISQHKYSNNSLENQLLFDLVILFLSVFGSMIKLCLTTFLIILQIILCYYLFHGTFGLSILVTVNCLFLLSWIYTLEKLIHLRMFSYGKDCVFLRLTGDFLIQLFWLIFFLSFCRTKEIIYSHRNCFTTLP